MLRDARDHQVSVVSLVCKDSRATLDLREHQELLGQQDEADLRVFKDSLDPPVSLDNQAAQVSFHS